MSHSMRSKETATGGSWHCRNPATNSSILTAGGLPLKVTWLSSRQSNTFSISAACTPASSCNSNHLLELRSASNSSLSMVPPPSVSASIAIWRMASANCFFCSSLSATSLDISSALVEIIPSATAPVITDSNAQLVKIQKTIKIGFSQGTSVSSSSKGCKAQPAMSSKRVYIESGIVPKYIRSSIGSRLPASDSSSCSRRGKCGLAGLEASLRVNAPTSSAAAYAARSAFISSGNA
mmetsp:Transcript_47124/g.115469  ORF Transcript_47124/g.115469 Transcript_47124/m.115469 type:complete len:236 (+) Transcript_47124:112-819(+)